MIIEEEITSQMGVKISSWHSKPPQWVEITITDALGG